MTSVSRMIRELVRDADRELDQAREAFQLAAALVGDRTEVEVSAEDWHRAKSQRAFGVHENSDGSVTITVET